MGQKPWVPYGPCEQLWVKGSKGKKPRNENLSKLTGNKTSIVNKKSVGSQNWKKETEFNTRIKIW